MQWCGLCSRIEQKHVRKRRRTARVIAQRLHEPTVLLGQCLNKISLVDSLNGNPVAGREHEGGGVDLVDVLALRVDQRTHHHPLPGPSVRIAGFEQATVCPFDSFPRLCIDEQRRVRHVPEPYPASQWRCFLVFVLAEDESHLELEFGFGGLKNSELAASPIRDSVLVLFAKLLGHV